MLPTFAACTLLLAAALGLQLFPFPASLSTDTSLLEESSFSCGCLWPCQAVLFVGSFGHGRGADGHSLFSSRYQEDGLSLFSWKTVTRHAALWHAHSVA